MAAADDYEASQAPRERATCSPGFDASVEEQSALDQYLRDVSRHELITPDREKELGARAQKGDEEAIQELARANLRFVISVAKKYQNRGVSLTDLIQEGNVGLVTAARKFDPEQGVKFISLRRVVDPAGDSRGAREPRPCGSRAAQPGQRPGPHLPREGAAQAGAGARADAPTSWPRPPT